MSDIAKNGGLIPENEAKFFELRFGYALQRAGIIPGYEVAGEASSTLDFGFTSSGGRLRDEVQHRDGSRIRLMPNKKRFCHAGLQPSHRR